MLTNVYQPMVGAFACSLYQLLYQALPGDCSGYSKPELHRELFLLLGLKLNEEGRQRFIDETSRLEAVGLLKTSQVGLAGQSDFIYEYELYCPLHPQEFNENPHLVMLLHNHMGKRYTVRILSELMYAKEDEGILRDETWRENVSAPFYEIFKLDATSDELEHDLSAAMPEVRETAPRSTLDLPGFTFADIILRFPKTSPRRMFVERLRGDEERIFLLNTLAYEYGKVDVVEVARILDEAEVWDARGNFELGNLRERFSEVYLQNNKRKAAEKKMVRKIVQQQSLATVTEPDMDEAAIVGELDPKYYLPLLPRFEGLLSVEQYNLMMRFDDHKSFLARHYYPYVNAQEGSVPPEFSSVLETAEHEFGLPKEVINVLIYYVLRVSEEKGGAQRLSGRFIESIVHNMASADIRTYEKAILYVHNQAKLEQQLAKQEGRRAASGAGTGQRSGTNAGGGRGKRGGAGGGGAGVRRPVMQVVESEPVKKPTPAQMKELMRLVEMDEDHKNP
jgi:replication initiation and membrane attachment protein